MIAGRGGTTETAGTASLQTSRYNGPAEHAGTVGTAPSLGSVGPEESTEPEGAGLCELQHCESTKMNRHLNAPSQSPSGRRPRTRRHLADGKPPADTHLRDTHRELVFMD